MALAVITARHTWLGVGRLTTVMRSMGGVRFHRCHVRHAVMAGAARAFDLRSAAAFNAMRRRAHRHGKAVENEGEGKKEPGGEAKHEHSRSGWYNA